MLRFGGINSHGRLIIKGCGHLSKAFAFNQELLLFTQGFCLSLKAFAIHQRLLPFNKGFCLLPKAFAFYQRLLTKAFAAYQRLLPLIQGFCHLSKAFATYPRLLPLIKGYSYLWKTFIIEWSFNYFNFSSDCQAYAWALVIVALQDTPFGEFFILGRYNPWASS